MSRAPAAARSRRRLAGRVLFAAFLAAVAFLLIRQAREVDWSAVAGAIAGYETWRLLLAIGLAAASYLIYCGYDLLGRRYTGHDLGSGRVVAIAFVSYAFNLNMGALIGGAGFRFRLYSRAGLKPGVISRVLAFSVVTNWLGYALLLGIVFAARAVAVPPGWEIGATGMQVAGWLSLALVAGYLLLCRIRSGQAWRVRGHDIELPTLPTALAQLALSSANWLVIASIVALLLPGEVAFATVLGALLLGAVAGALSHVPAGLGVLEAVFIALLGHQIDRSALLAAALSYRALYYLLPLLAAIAAYFVLEARSRRGGTDSRPV